MPYETLPPVQRRSYDLLVSALYGVHLAESERAALWWVASSATAGHVRALARLIARARTARSGVDALEVMPEPVMPPVAAAELGRHGLLS